MPRIMVTGANGYIGAHVVSALCDISQDQQMVNPHFRVHPLSYNPAAAVA